LWALGVRGYTIPFGGNLANWRPAPDDALIAGWRGAISNGP
jgi:hypothetical protein